MRDIRELGRRVVTPDDDVLNVVAWDIQSGSYLLNSKRRISWSYNEWICSGLNKDLSILNCSITEEYVTTEILIPERPLRPN